ncbi:MAG: phytanoyl-CoA dioxygenase family protein [Chloroflexota bacterium]
MSMRLSQEQVQQFQEDGYVMVPGFFPPEYMELLIKIAKADRVLDQQASNRRDAQGGVSRLRLRYDIEPDIYGAFAACERIVRNTELLLGKGVYHYHHKMMLKEPRIGGAWEWHQDYGYWYNYGFLFPDMISAMIAVDRASRKNGCLQVIRGSHKMGRIDHGKAGDQTGANLERVEAALQRMELVYCEMELGTVLFFHSNLLHCSDQNKSDDPRWSLICCYFAQDNKPYKHEPRFQPKPLEVWPDERILDIGRRQWEQMQAQATAVGNG